MLSTHARRAAAARRTLRALRTATIALGLIALCALAGCAHFIPRDRPRVVQLPSVVPEPVEPIAEVAPGSVRVRVQADQAEGASPTVVYLTTDRAMPGSKTPTQEVAIGRANGGLSPAFITATVEQNLKFRVADNIHHHIFSKSEIGAFDLGPLGNNESKRISFGKPGILRLYCSLHPSENAALYIAPSPHFAEVPASGEVELSGLLPGRYQVHAWSESGPAMVANVEVRSGAVSPVELRRPDREARD
jgi:plastocyanin